MSSNPNTTADPVVDVAAAADTVKVKTPKAKKSKSTDAHDHAGLTQADRDTLTAFFRSKSIADVSPALLTATSKLITLKDTDKMRDALATLNDNKISSAPVRFTAHTLDEKWSAAGIAPDSPLAFRGMIDTMDIVFFLAEQYAINKRKHDHLFDPKELDSAFDAPISVYVNESGRDPFVAVDAKTNVADLCEHFFNWGIRRVPVAVDNNIVASISQSDVVKFIFENLDKLGALSSCKMLDLRLVGTHHVTNDDGSADDKSIPPLVSVLDNATVLEAVQLMTKHKISAVAIVDVNGKLVGNFSASDLKGVTTTKLFELESKLVDVLIYNNTFRAPLACSVDAALSVALKRIVEARAHRIYIIDTVTHRARGVVTLTDIIRGIVRELSHSDGLDDDDDDE